MICPNCKTKVLNEAVFCPECGENLAKTVVEAVDTDNVTMSSETETYESASSTQIIEPVIPFAVQAPDVSVSPTPVSAPSAVKVSAPLAVEVPKEYKPFSTVSAFFYLILISIPVVGFISLLAFAFGSRNKNRKSVSRAILISGILCIILIAAAALVFFLIFQTLVSDIFNAESVEEILELLADEFGLN